MRRAALLLAVLVLLEIVSARVWARLKHTGTEPEREVAALAWTGGVRALDLVLLFAAFPRVPLAASRRSLRLGCLSVSGFGIGVLAGQLASGGRLLGLLRGPPDPAYAAAGPVLAALAVMVLLGPFVEERMFRGILLPALRERMPAWAAVLLSAGLFALFHALAGQPFPVVQLAGGLVFAWLAIETGGILAGFLVHAAANAFILALQVFYRP